LSSELQIELLGIFEREALTEPDGEDTSRARAADQIKLLEQLAASWVVVQLSGHVSQDFDGHQAPHASAIQAQDANASLFL